MVHPILQESTAYWMLRPFFKPTVKGSLEGWKFSLDDTEGNVLFHGANPGTPQEHTPENHPHLRLEETMIPYPQVEPGDTVFWSADTIHGTEMKNTGTQDACVFYIPSVPLTDGNIVSIKTGQQMRQGHVILVRREAGANLRSNTSPSNAIRSSKVSRLPTSLVVLASRSSPIAPPSPTLLQSRASAHWALLPSSAWLAAAGRTPCAWPPTRLWGMLPTRL